MLIHDMSRIGQLSTGGTRKFDSLLSVSLFTVENLAAEISRQIDTLPAESYAAGMAWYAQANAFAHSLAADYDSTPEIVAGVISAVSPRMSWPRNKIVAQEIFAQLSGQQGYEPNQAAMNMGLGLVSNVSMAVRIARGEEIAETLTGTKRRSFYNNIAHPFEGDSVTIDTWMVRAFMSLDGSLSLSDATAILGQNKTALGGTGFGYYLLAEACRKVAAERMIRPHQAQALYWIAVSGSADGLFGK